MDRLRWKEFPAMPPGRGRVSSGPIRPDDLLFAWPAAVWLRYDSPDWNGSPVIDADDAIVVARAGSFIARPNESRRPHLIGGGPENVVQDLATPDPAFSARDENAGSGVVRQRSLFE